jgi:hypothetical protein
MLFEVDEAQAQQQERLRLLEEYVARRRERQANALNPELIRHEALSCVRDRDPGYMVDYGNPNELAGERGDDEGTGWCG